MGSAFRKFTHLVSTYSVLNFLIISTYALVRFRFASLPVSQFGFNLAVDQTYSAFEQQVLLALFVTAAWRSMKARGHGFTFATILGFTQLFVLGMAFLASRVLAIYYGLAFLLVALLFPEPMRDWIDEVEPTTPLEDFSKLDDGVTRVVFLHADYSISCRRLASMFSELAEQYTTDKLKFYRLNVGLFPAYAKKLDLDVSPMSLQLPTVALYEKGEEVKVVPKKTGDKLYGTDFKKRDLIKTLELDMRYTRSMGSASSDIKSKAA